MMMKGNAIILIRGLLRPLGFFRLSEMEPTMGSVMASHRVPREIRAPAKAADRPTTSFMK